MKKIIDLLHTGDYSCVIANQEDVRTFTRRGVADLYDLLKNDPDFLKGASVADKVIGKAAAALLISGGVKEIYTDRISRPAIDLLAETSIGLVYVQEVPYICNRDQTGWCPLELLTEKETSPEEMVVLIGGFIEKMRAK